MNLLLWSTEFPQLCTNPKSDHELYSWLAFSFDTHTHLCWITVLPLRNPSVKSTVIPANRFQKNRAEAPNNHKLPQKKFKLASGKVCNVKIGLFLLQ